MTRRRSVLIVSNGHGEDAVGAALARRLPADVLIRAFPLVGLGGAYGAIPLLEPRHLLPSGGFALRGGWRHLWADLRAGGAALWLGQRRALRAQRRVNLVIGIGDTYCLWMASLARPKVVFVATAKSESSDPHRALERSIIRRAARLVFARDGVTARALALYGIAARWVGNVLMDTIADAGPAPHLAGGLPTVTLLPGSRSDAAVTLPHLLRLCELVGRRGAVGFMCALAPHLDHAALTTAARRVGWSVEDDTLRLGGTTVALTHAFRSAVTAADVVVGLAGTANEQAAGLGKPVVAFPGPGMQYTTRFLGLQRRLLGDALVGASGWRDAADAVLRLLADGEERRRRGEVGKARMGGPGAVAQIAAEVARMVAEG